MAVIRICKEYYLMEIDGKKVAVLRRFTPITSRWFASDGTEYTSTDHMEQIMSQFDEDHKLDIAVLYDIVNDLNAVEYTDVSDEDNPGRKAIVLNNNDSILGFPTDGNAENLITMSDENKVEVGTGSYDINFNGLAERSTYNEENSFAFVDDVKNSAIKISSLPIGSFNDEVYDKSVILGWFGVTNEEELKQVIEDGGILYIKYGVYSDDNPKYYQMPVNYIGFESDTQLKVVFLGLNTADGTPSKYEIVMNLDGIVISGNSNVSAAVSVIA